ncbi:hypothetical protein ACQ4PT_026847 [Festuca glaucescens]
MADGAGCGWSINSGNERRRKRAHASGDDEGQAAPAHWPCIHDGRLFLLESWRRGEPKMRPDSGRIVIARTAGMDALEKQLYGLAVYVTIEGGVRVAAEALLGALQRQCGIQPTAMKVEAACPPYHFFIRFDSVNDCAQVLYLKPLLRCGGAGMSIRRWCWDACGTPGKMEYKSLVSIEGLPEQAWEVETVNNVLAGVGGRLEEMLPPTDRWVLPVTAWLQDPCAIPKSLTVVLPTPTPPPMRPSSDEGAESPSPPRSPTMKRTQEFNLFMHVKEVIDRGRLLIEGPSDGFYSDEEDLTRRHTFPTWRGKIDGTGPGDHGYA